MKESELSRPMPSLTLCAQMRGQGHFCDCPSPPMHVVTFGKMLCLLDICNRLPSGQLASSTELLLAELHRPATAFWKSCWEDPITCFRLLPCLARVAPASAAFLPHASKADVSLWPKGMAVGRVMCIQERPISHLRRTIRRKSELHASQGTTSYTNPNLEGGASFETPEAPGPSQDDAKLRTSSKGCQHHRCTGLPAAKHLDT